VTQIGLETWRGAVKPWHIDEMGHMNVRYYVAIAMEALTGLAGALGMPRAFSAGAGATLLVREHHVRFLREARVGAPLHMRCAVLQMGETDARLLQVLFHSESGEPAAALVTRVEHVTPRDLRPFAWAQSARELAKPLMVAAPDYALPRGLSGEPAASRARLTAADALGLSLAASGALTPLECDAFGRMRPDHLLERISNGLPHMLTPLRPALDQALSQLAGKLGGATVEFRALYHRWPGAGDSLTLRSGLGALTPKARRLVHWLLDPVTGQAWASAEMIVLFFDLNARKAMQPPVPILQALAPQVIEGLGL
jgi:acyl-CoA thioester hydrolase